MVGDYLKRKNDLATKIEKLIMEYYHKNLKEIDLLLINRKGYFVSGSEGEGFQGLVENFNETELRLILTEVEYRENLNFLGSKKLLMIYVDHEYDFKFDWEDF